ncbi:hypothetical protein [Microbacterium sp. USHLN186]|uniref:hypothetical protein n=1 Tax=Microbacterium sp. USHLN186 TaxID=3081286 RepID=UPI003018D701
MLTIAPAQAPSAADLWAVLTALRLLDDAAEDAAAARIEAARLTDETRWQAAGPRRLRQALTEYTVHLARLADELWFQRDQIARNALG